MNIGYIFDLCNIVDQPSIKIPYLSGLHWFHLDKPDLITSSNLVEKRNETIQKYAGQEIEKQLFFIVVGNERALLESLSTCIQGVQKDQIHFAQDRYEFHILFNITDEEGASIQDYEQKMSPCLTNNAIPTFSWIVDNYDEKQFPITPERRAHAIARLCNMLCMHSGNVSIRQMDNSGKPIYYVFGNSSIIFDETQRDDAVKNYYCYKNLQHLLNLSDASIDSYITDHILRYQGDQERIDKEVDITSGSFLKEQNTPIEATKITDRTQNLLIKSSDDDKEYLVDVVGNKLLFIEELSRKQEYQMKDTASFLKQYSDKVDIDEDHQETITEVFLKDLQEKVAVHRRTILDKVNNELSKNRLEQVRGFEEKVDGHLQEILNKSEYTNISEILTPEDVKSHGATINTAIAFLEYLETGRCGYLVDHEVSAGDISFDLIKRSLGEKKKECSREYEAYEEELREKYEPRGDEDKSSVQKEFDKVDTRMKNVKGEISALNFQLEHWIDEDAGDRKFTARTRSVFYAVCGLVFSAIWMFLYLKFLRPAFTSLFESVHYADVFNRWVFAVGIFAGLLTGLICILKVVIPRNRLMLQLKEIKTQKNQLMGSRINEMKSLIEKQYRYMTAFHGQKTILDLIDYVQTKQMDLFNFRRTLFRLMLKYKLSMVEEQRETRNDQNTIILNDLGVVDLLFGPGEEKQKDIPFGFARSDVSLAQTFDSYRRKCLRLETTRFAWEVKPQNTFDSKSFDPEPLEKEIIPARKADEAKNLDYSVLQRDSLLAHSSSEISIDDVHQGSCGDCYFMATLASITKMNPDYIIGKNGMIEELGNEHRFFRVKFYDKDGSRVCVDVDNKFWNQDGTPIYAQMAKSESNEETSYDPWVMAVEKAWAKVNGEGYDGIEGASADGKERSRMYEYSYAVTGKTAFYCMTRSVPQKDQLLEIIKKHVLTDKLPITLYSASEHDDYYSHMDECVVTNHAYSLKSIDENGLMDLFNPWNQTDQESRGKHFSKVDIDFIMDNFDVIVFFGIKEADFTTFERTLTNNVTEKELSDTIVQDLNKQFEQLALPFKSMTELMTEDSMRLSFNYSSVLFNKNRFHDDRGIEGTSQWFYYIEATRDHKDANQKLIDFLNAAGQFDVTSLNVRSDGKNSITLLLVSPSYILSNFN